MLLMKKCGGTPCDRRLDRRKVAIAAAAALLVLAGSATSARADTAWQIDPARSFLFHDQYALLPPAAGGPQWGTAQAGTAYPNGGTGGPGNSDWAPVQGVLLTAGDATHIQLMTGGMQGLLTTGSYAPGLLANGAVDPNGIEPGNYGLSAAGFIISNDNNISTDVMPSPYGSALMTSLGAPGKTIGNSVMPLVPTGPGTYQFPIGALSSTNLGQALIADRNVFPQTGGAEDIFAGIFGEGHTSFKGSSALPISLNTPLISGSFSGLPTPVQTVYSAWTQGGVGTLDTNTMTLTIPVDSLLQISESGITVYTMFFGTLVATPVPEPSTVTLFGFGVAGLLSYAWRARRRRSVA